MCDTIEQIKKLLRTLLDRRPNGQRNDDDDEEWNNNENHQKISGNNGHFNSKFFYRKYGINFRIVQENNNKKQHRMNTTCTKPFIFSRYCWSGYLSKGGTKYEEREKTSHITKLQLLF